VIALYDSPFLEEEQKKLLSGEGEGFVELEPFERERHASGSRFNLKLELRI
jgi:hypothetical protein